MLEMVRSEIHPLLKHLMMDEDNRGTQRGNCFLQSETMHPYSALLPLLFHFSSKAKEKTVTGIYHPPPKKIINYLVNIYQEGRSHSG